MADENGGLTGALVALAGEDLRIPKNREARVMSQRGAYTYRYADLGDLLSALRPALHRHGLAFASWVACDTAGRLEMRYELRHTSGEMIAGAVPLGMTADAFQPQALGSVITYMRRYVLQSLVCVAAEEDDDGRAAQEHAAHRPSRPAGGPEATPTVSTRTASAAQRGMLNSRAAERRLSATQYANAILRAADQPEREFSSQEDAMRFLQRQMDRLPAHLVDRVLREIQATASQAPAGPAAGEPTGVAA